MRRLRRRMMRVMKKCKEEGKGENVDKAGDSMVMRINCLLVLTEGKKILSKVTMLQD